MTIKNEMRTGRDLWDSPEQGLSLRHKHGIHHYSPLEGVVEKDPFLESRGDTPFDW